MGPSTCDEIPETMNLPETVSVKELVTVTCVPCGSSKLTPSTLQLSRKEKSFPSGGKMAQEEALTQFKCPGAGLSESQLCSGDGSRWWDISHCDLGSLD